MKSQRHYKILELIRNYPIETQEELANLLKEKGVNITQATISRDIKNLGLVKTLGKDGRYIYTLPENTAQYSFNSKLVKMLQNSVVSIDYAENIVVIKTISGTASAVALAIDGLNFKNIVGTIAGDDTIFSVVRSHEHVQEFIEEIKELL